MGGQMMSVSAQAALAAHDRREMVEFRAFCAARDVSPESGLAIGMLYASMSGEAKGAAVALGFLADSGVITPPVPGQAGRGERA
jgi:hypothetical protein